MSVASANFLRDHKLKAQGFLRHAPGNDIEQLPHRQLHAFGVIDGAIGCYEREQAREREREAARRKP